MSDLPVSLPRELEPTFVGALDRAGKLVAALESLGPVADRDVLVVDARGGPIVTGITGLGARVTSTDLAQPFQLRLRMNRRAG